MTQRIEVVERILGANDKLAEHNRARLDEAGVWSMNMLASPGAGKTTLLERTIEGLGRRLRIGVIEGDIATSLDADRAAAAGAAAVQVNTGGQCHLDAAMIDQALDSIDLAAIDLLIVENVGNLICPAAFALGTHATVVVASVPEGDDKPYKYPGTYRGIDALVINKIDLLPYIEFDMERFRRGVEILNGDLVTFPVSCRTGDGLDAWMDWVVERERAARAARP